MKSECTSNIKNAIIVFEENRSKLVLNNKFKKNVKKVIVDGCQIKSGMRCDHYFEVKETEHYIELKGQDVSHALEQVSNTISDLSSNPQRKKKVVFIICTRSPYSSAKIQNLRLKFKKKFNADLIIKGSPFEYII